MTETIRKRYRLSPEGNVLALWSLILGVAGFCIPVAAGPPRSCWACWG